jgi:hypothetical protein
LEGFAVNPELEKLIALQELDLEIRELQKEIADVPRKKAEIERQFNEFAAEYLDKKTRLDTSRREHRQLELDLLDTQQKLEKYKSDLMRVRNQTEYSAALREIDTAKKTIGGLETQILEKLETIEALDHEVKTRTPEIEAKRHQFDVLIADYSTATDRLTLQLNKLHERRQQLVATIRRDWLGRYNRLADTRDGLALAEVRDGSCKACFMSVRPQVYADVRKGDDILTCDNCSRILYFKAVQVEGTNTAA